jgi:hypothetical protein
MEADTCIYDNIEFTKLLRAKTHALLDQGPAPGIAASINASDESPVRIDQAAERMTRWVHRKNTMWHEAPVLPGSSLHIGTGMCMPAVLFGALFRLLV